MIENLTRHLPEFLVITLEGLEGCNKKLFLEDRIITSCSVGKYR